MAKFREYLTLLCTMIALGAIAAPSSAQNAFYEGKRITLMVNFAEGGASSTEARVVARHLGRMIDGNPTVIVQNMEGAGGLVAAKWLGEIAPRDGTIVGYFTGAAFLYAIEPERFKVDFRTYEFIGVQPSTSINFIRADVEPGIKTSADLLKAKGVVIGALAPDSGKGVRMRLAFDILGVPYKFVSGYRSGGAVKLAIERNEVNFYGESGPNYFSQIVPLVQAGSVIPLYFDSIYDGAAFLVPGSMKDAPVPPFHEYHQKVKGQMPSGSLWEAYKGLAAADGTLSRLIVMPPKVPAVSVTTLRAALNKLNADKDYAEDGKKVFGFIPIWRADADNNQVAVRSMTMAPEIRTFLQEYIKNPPK